jgi:sec-independent protein translocase protein TatA
MFGLGLPEVLVIFVVILLLFKAKALPEIVKGLGQALKLFRKEVTRTGDNSHPKTPEEKPSPKKKTKLQ